MAMRLALEVNGGWRIEIKYKTFFISLSVAFVVAGLTALFVFGLPLGIDFKGGSQLELGYASTRPDISTIKTAVATAGFPEALIQPVGTNAVSIKTQTITDAQQKAIVSSLSSDKANTVTVNSFTTIGPSIGAELKHKAIVSIALVLGAIILFVAYAFRKVSKPVSSWKYGLAVIIALAWSANCCSIFLIKSAGSTVILLI